MSGQAWMIEADGGWLVHGGLNSSDLRQSALQSWLPASMAALAPDPSAAAAVQDSAAKVMAAAAAVQVAAA